MACTARRPTGTILCRLPFPVTRRGPFFEVKRREIEIHRLGYPHARGIHELQESSVTGPEGGLVDGSCDQSLNLVDRQRLGQRRPQTRAIEQDRRVFGSELFGDQEPMQAAHRRNLASDGGRFQSGGVELGDVRDGPAGRGIIVSQVGQVIAKVASVGCQGVGRQTAFGAEECEELLHAYLQR